MAFHFNSQVAKQLASIFALCLLSIVAVAQDAKPSADTASAPKNDKNPMGLVQLTQNKSFLFPAIASSTGPMSVGDKFKLSVANTVSPFTILCAAGSAGFNQAWNSPEGWGQGGEAYGKRFGAAMARTASANIFGTGILNSVFHEDPRFYVKKDLSFGNSVKYSVARIFVTKSDSGKATLNVGDLVGPLGAEFLANTYYPPGDRSTGDALVRYGWDIAAKIGGNLLKQYWPTINKKLLQPKDKK